MKSVGILLIICLLILVIWKLVPQHNSELNVPKKTQTYEEVRKELEDIVQKQDPRMAIDTLRQKSEANKEIMSSCHELLHSIGKAAFSKYSSFKEAVRYQNEFCNSGYIHGIFEGYFKTHPDTLADLTQQCKEYSQGKTAFDAWQCYHGIGHGFMYDSFGKLDLSLQRCKDEVGTPYDTTCENGVYMEVFNSEVLEYEPDYVEAKDPFATCSQRSEAKNDCYIFVPTYMSQTLQYSFETILQKCDLVEEGYQNVCVSGVGAEAVKRNMDSIADVFSLCAKASSLLAQNYCVAGGVSMYMNQKGSYSAGKEFCQHSPSQYKKVCTDTVLGQKDFFTTVL